MSNKLIQRVTQIRLNNNLAKWIEKYALDTKCVFNTGRINLRRTILRLVVTGLWYYYKEGFSLTTEELSSLTELSKDIGVKFTILWVD